MPTLYDSFRNFAARLGGGTLGEKTAGDTYSLYNPPSVYTPGEADAAYRTSWFRKIVDIPPLDMTRKWRDWQAEDSEIEDIEAEEKRLGVRTKVREALTLARLKGGSVILLGALDGQSAQPLDPETIRKGGLIYIHVVDRDGIQAGELDKDPLSPTFREPTVYKINAGDGRPQVSIHPTRVVRFLGNKIPEGPTSGSADGWGDSMWMVVERYVKNADLTSSGIAAMIHEAKIDVIKVPRLMASMATAELKTALLSRFNIANQLKSINNMLLLDSEEEWERKEMNFGSLPDVLDRFVALLAGVSDIPATRLLGKSPDGQNATGDSDTRNYYDMLQSRQNDELSPALERLDECLIRSALGARPDTIYYEWAKLWQETPAEQATTSKTKAETVKIYADAGLVPNGALAKGVQNMLIEDGLLPGLEAAIAEAEAAGEVPTITEQLTPAEEADLAVRTAAATAKATGAPANSNRPPPRRAAGDALITDATPRTLYVRRDLLNAAEVIAWAKGQGFKSTLKAADMHVTVAFSRTPVDWMAIGQSDFGTEDGRMVVAPGGPRLVETLGAATVLLFASWSLAWRHGDIRRAGASWDWPEFQPHITLTYEPGDVNLSEIEPYRGRLVFGPEIFEEINDGWRENIVEA